MGNMTNYMKQTECLKCLGDQEMRWAMNNEFETGPIKFSWGKVAAICFAAGGLYTLVNINTEHISKLEVSMESKFTRSLDSQTKSNTKLSDSIVNLNVTIARLEESLRNRDADIQEIKETLQVHDEAIRNNHDGIVRFANYVN